MEKKINYQKELQKVLKNIENTKNKPKLLLHACCGPCFTIPFEILKDFFDITIIYNNSNIYPEEEHFRRLNELKKYISDINANIKLIEIPYDNLTYNKDLEPFGNLAEGHERCRVCFRKRLAFGFKYAEKNGFDFFTTVMTISRYKNAQDINKIGYELESRFKSVKWLPADFKKENGYEQSLILIKEHEMYFQEYCGCIYSYKKYQEKCKK
jgi:predicted adenine nucleotide alpha hydrolase (AANH) superfamily ATPase